MKTVLLRHKKTLCIIACCAAVISVAAIAAVFFSPNDVREEIPPGRIHDSGVFGEDIVAYDSSGGVNIIGADPFGYDIVPLSAPPRIVSNPDEIWTGDTFAGNHTFVESARMQNGSIGLLAIPAIQLSVNVYESQNHDNMEAMLKGAAHFSHTSAFDGNVGMSTHNVNFDGSDGYFKHLYKLEKGDTITYKTALGERTYTVASISTIDASDWTPLYYTDDNRLTLITCISGQPDKRLRLVAFEAVN